MMDFEGSVSAGSLVIPDTLLLGVGVLVVGSLNVWGQGVYGNYLLLNFSVNIKLL